jgi:hypothetical protein
MKLSQESINVLRISEERIKEYNNKFHLEYHENNTFDQGVDVYFGNNSYPHVYYDYDKVVIALSMYLKGLSDYLLIIKGEL